MSDLHRALTRELARLYPALELRTSRSEDWASITFVGARHRFEFAPAPAPNSLLEAEFHLRGHIVADVTVTAEPEALVVEILSIAVA